MAKKNIKITCYGITKEYENIDDAVNEYALAIVHSEGSEKARYTYILEQLLLTPKTEISDKDWEED